MRHCSCAGRASSPLGQAWRTLQGVNPQLLIALPCRARARSTWVLLVFLSHLVPAQPSPGARGGQAGLASSGLPVTPCPQLGSASYSPAHPSLPSHHSLGSSNYILGPLIVPGSPGISRLCSGLGLRCTPCPRQPVSAQASLTPAWPLAPAWFLRILDLNSPYASQGDSMALLA